MIKKHIQIKTLEDLELSEKGKASRDNCIKLFDSMEEINDSVFIELEKIKTLDFFLNYACPKCDLKDSDAREIRKQITIIYDDI